MRRLFLCRASPADHRRASKRLDARLWWLYSRGKAGPDRRVADHILLTTIVASALPHLGVSKPTLYQYFSSKQEILYRCHQLALDQGDAGIALAEVDRGSGLEKLFIYLKTYMRGFFGEIGAGPVLTEVDSLTPANRKKVVERRARISAATTRFIAQGVKNVRLVNACPKHTSLFALC